jgi:hypothetical protein
MNPASRKGNNPERWEKFLVVLDERLQLGLLSYLQSIASYHFEEETLYIEPSGAKDMSYLSRPAVLQQLELLAKDILDVKEVKIKTP